MTKEWLNQWNPFNSAKVLLWREHLERCAKGDFLPPVTVSTDPSGRCNYNCIWCNAYEILEYKDGDLSRDHLIRLADFYAEWGVKSTCVAGGGEPFANPYTGEMLLRLKENEIEVAPVTNGSLLNSELIDIIARTARWTGFSMDAACSSTYMKVKGIQNLDMFERVLDNIRKLVKRIKELGRKNDVGYKFLLHPLNSKEIFKAAQLAKSLGVYDFQIRPVGWTNNLKTKDTPDLNYYGRTRLIDQQIEMAMELEDENFHVYGIRHKFKPDFQKQVNFESCCASPMLLTFGSDGNCYICLDRRGQKEMVLCSHYPDPKEVLKYWSSDRHRDIIQAIDITKCPRCTIAPYHEIVEQVFKEDRMCRDFI